MQSRLKKLHELTDLLLSKLEENSLEHAFPLRQASVLIRRIVRQLKAFYEKIWDRSTERTTRKKLLNSLETINERLANLPPEVFSRIDFDLGLNLIKAVYLTGGEEYGRTLLKNRREEVTNDSQHLSSLADLAMNLGLYSESLSLMEDLKEITQLSTKEMYNYALLLYMVGKTEKALDAIEQLERKGTFMAHTSHLKASVNIALTRLDEAKKALGSGFAKVDK